MALLRSPRGRVSYPPRWQALRDQLSSPPMPRRPSGRWPARAWDTSAPWVGRSGCSITTNIASPTMSTPGGSRLLLPKRERTCCGSSKRRYVVSDRRASGGGARCRASTWRSKERPSSAFRWQSAPRSSRRRRRCHGSTLLSTACRTWSPALVERGAPRDFRDIYTLCREGRVTARECWRLWRERQERAGSDADPHRVRLAVETHLSRIAQHRPLAVIAEPEQRAAAAILRNWFAQEFLDALLD
jgi:hypothetical protein